MESKLPKPSAIKRPLAVNKSVLPMDRIKSAAMMMSAGLNHKANQFLGGGAASVQMVQPLTRDPTNIQQNIRNRGRAESPEAVSNNAMRSRGKLRRSRSACDIRDLRSLKRVETTLAPIPRKAPRLMSTSTLGSALCSTLPSLSGGTNSVALPSRIGSSSGVSNTTSAAANRPIGQTVRSRRVGTNAHGSSNAASKKVATAGGSSTAVSTTGACKPINKRIPPYDFKARYNDLLEKYKALKEKYEEKCEQMGNLETLPEQLEDTQTQLISTQEQLKNTQTDNECLRRQVKSQKQKIDSVAECLANTKEELELLKQAHNRIKSEHHDLSNEVVELRERSTALEEKNANLLEEISICKEQVFRSNLERKELHNTIMDLRGNIRVFCRVRPPLESELDKPLCGWNYIDETTLEIQNLDGVGVSKIKNAAHTFSFDQVFHPDSNQDSIFEMVSPLIQSALDGYNICIFAYGQTGSGKTYTMDGVSTNPGVIPRTVDLLFDAVKNYRNLGWEYEIKVTFLEIYNEVLYDLLSNEPKDMEIRMTKNNRNDIYVSNITQETVSNAGRLRHLMQIAKMNRATAATVSNERSSRSHAVTKIELIGMHVEKQEITIGSINLVDLAGSESPKTSTRMNETKNINRSLSELTNVILALLQKQDHIPYRNSKLTHLLMPSLGGNSKTLMFINVAPFQECFVESLKSLRFAATVNSCKVAKAKRNRFLNTSCSSSNSFEK